METGEATINWNELLLSALRVGLTHEQFWSLTPKEIAMSIEAYNENKKDELQLWAWAVSLIVSYTGRLKKPIQPNELLAEQTQKRISPERKQEEWDAIQKRFKEV